MLGAYVSNRNERSHDGHNKNNRGQTTVSASQSACKSQRTLPDLRAENNMPKYLGNLAQS